LDKINIEFPDGSRKEFPGSVTGLEIAASISERLKRESLVVSVNGELQDLSFPIDRDAKVLLFTIKDPEAREVYRHTSSHIMAQAVKRLFPDALLTIGPAVDEGFYYDIDSSHRFTEADFPLIEEEIRKIIKEDLPISRKLLSKQEALALYTKEGNPYKLEIIGGIQDDGISFYYQGEFADLCRGPHLPSTGRVKLIKLLSVAGAYWRGSEKNKMLQRLYAEAFGSEQQWKDYLKRKEEAEKRDHRRIGKDLDLYSINEEAGPGLVFWHPNGSALRSVIEDFWRREHQKRGYQIMYTPHIANAKLWKTSGHLENYGENMYSPMDIDGTDFIIKPMNCPFHILIYKDRLRSYRELPFRWAELGTVYRYEKSGVLHGMLRVRGFTQDDAHIFCRLDQLEHELDDTLSLAFYMLKTFGFEHYKIMLATRPEKYVGDQAGWEKATNALRSALASQKADFTLDEGGGAFYGPKIDIKLVDAIGREWQGPTIQVDFNLPERFQMEYIGQDGKPHRPVMVHRAVLGSMERFVGTLVEHYGGRFPLWLAPVQVLVLTLGAQHAAFAAEVRDLFQQALVRVELDDTENKLGYKVREAQVRQIPYMLVIGDREVEDKTVSVRSRSGENIGALTARAALDRILNEIASKQ